MRSTALLAVVLAIGFIMGCHGMGVGAVHDGDLALIAPPGWSAEILPGGQSGIDLVVLKRPAPNPPARYRVVVIPGSGCTGWLPLANRYFAGLLHAELWVLHKPHVDVNAGAGADCTPLFVQSDSLSGWRDHARAALRTLESRKQEEQRPELLVGISEGAELLPELAAEMPRLAGVVMVAAPGLDPRETGELQALRLDQWPAWQSLEMAQSSASADEVFAEGRTLRYWRDFWRWPLARPLLDGPWPLLRVWGDADERVPLAAYQRFTVLADRRAAPFCDLLLPGADHSLQAGQRDGVQWLWARLEIWARFPTMGFCDRVVP